MIKGLLLVILLLLNSFFIFSFENADSKIAVGLISVYGSGISLDQVNTVLEFDSCNKDALIKKAEFIDSNKESLYFAKNMIEKSEMPTLESRLYYISILYRLNLYTELISFSENIDYESINSADSLYFLSDSYIREGLLEKAVKILNVSTHQFPSDQRFLELFYLIYKDRGILSKIEHGESPLDSFLRLYNRVDDIIPKLILEILITRKIKTLKNVDLIKYHGNYSILPIIFESIPKDNFSGFYSFDTDSDTFPDTYYKIYNGIIQYKGLDRNRDNIIDYEIFLDNGVPKSVIVDRNILHYSTYPYIDYISIAGDNRVIYNLFKHYTKKKLSNLTAEPDLSLIISKIPELKIVSKIYYNEDQIISEWFFRSDESVLVYSEPNGANKFDKCLLLKKNVVVSGLRDLDSDGIYDLNEIYINGTLAGSAYSPSGKNGDVSYVEKYVDDGTDLTNKIDFNWWDE